METTSTTTTMTIRDRVERLSITTNIDSREVVTGAEVDHICSVLEIGSTTTKEELHDIQSQVNYLLPLKTQIAMNAGKWFEVARLARLYSATAEVLRGCLSDGVVNYWLHFTPANYFTNR